MVDAKLFKHSIYMDIWKGLSLKHLQFWLNERDYEQLKRRAKEMGSTPYQIGKKLVKEFLNGNGASSLIVYAIYYSLIVATIVLVLL